MDTKVVDVLSKSANIVTTYVVANGLANAIYVQKPELFALPQKGLGIKENLKRGATVVGVGAFIGIVASACGNVVGSFVEESFETEPQLEPNIE